MSIHPGWIGVDLDGTLVEYDRWRGPDNIGKPVPLMVNRVRQWLAEGKEVRIFTARVCVPVFADAAYIRRSEDARAARSAINEFCLDHFGHVLPITCEKDFSCIELWDDRCVQVETNTGRLIGDSL